MQSFNDQNLTSLKKDSRFEKSVLDNETRTSFALGAVVTGNKQQFFDIKGNTYKNTLIPKQTAHSAFKKGSSGEEI